jgi:hypothetical protein
MASDMGREIGEEIESWRVVGMVSPSRAALGMW